jgi:cyclophilin family peptidyl-prolyl cis-trans isomerase
MVSCNKKPKNLWLNNFEDATILQIADLQDRLNSDSLVMFLKSKKTHHRERAALALGTLQDTIAIPYLSLIVQTDKYIEPRRAAAFALGQIRHPMAKEALFTALATEMSIENQEYILEAIGKCGEAKDTTFFEKFNSNMPELYLGWTRGVFQLGLNNIYTHKIIDRVISERERLNQPMVKIVSAHFLYRLRTKLTKNQIETAQSWAQSEKNQEVRERLEMIWESQNEKPKADWSQEVWDSLSPYQKADYLHQITFENILIRGKEWLENTELHPVVKNEILTLLIDGSEGSVRESWIDFGMFSNDIALKSIAANAIVTYQLAKPLWVARCKDFLGSASLPKELETYLDVKKAMESMLGKPIETKKYLHNREVDWTAVKNIPHNQQVLIQTSKGDILLECLVNDAPATVWNFLTLIEEGYFSQKNFHRIVPHFVIQGGCPRGDGWGAENWTQRSEWSHYNRFDEGMVGIASVGKNTENVQFFITLDAAPHLDGRYTIFAKIIEGIEVVRSIEKGDEILNAKSINIKKIK